jgi:hypothetical protein
VLFDDYALQNGSVDRLLVTTVLETFLELAKLHEVGGGEVGCLRRCCGARHPMILGGGFVDCKPHINDQRSGSETTVVDDR